ncbi:MAG: phosphate ABC transporter permease PstA [Acidimicrobiales bacterium]|nr:phosphate ABC transporter permease PstA [Acidimicrobiales bacterium]RZV47661.1 MAG: phosphate ABC transporter permease PstA [Acidimicrobiales bacterium]
MAMATIGNSGAAERRVEDEIFRRGRDLRGSGFRTMLFAALAISILFLVVLLIQVFVDGWPVLDERFGDFWSGTLRSRSSDDKLGISQGMIGSFWIAVFVAVIAFPLGIAAAIYLEEYAPDNIVTKTIDIAIRNLAGVPSVVYGLLGLFLFVQTRELKDSTLYAGGITLAILVLPIVVITAAEAIRAVPSSLRQGAYGVGATKWDVIRTQILPFAAPGVLTGTLLALSRAVGEAAPLILVGAITGRLAPRDGSFLSLEQFSDRFTAMPIVIVGWVQESGRDAGFSAAAGAAIVVLLAFVISMNSVAVVLRNYFEKKRG